MNIEFFTSPDTLTTDNLIMHMGGEYIPFNKVSNQRVQELFVRITDTPDGRRAVTAIKHLGITEQKAIVRKFLQCNFGKLDNVPDMDQDGNFNYELTDCPQRKTCLYSGIICQKNY